MAREQRDEIVRRIRDRRHSEEINDFLKLCGLLLEQTKDKLVTATPETFAEQQGFAKAYQQLISLITRLEPKLKPDTE